MANGDHVNLYREWKSSGLSLSAFAKGKGKDKSNLNKAFKKIESDKDLSVDQSQPSVYQCENCTRIAMLKQHIETLEKRRNAEPLEVSGRSETSAFDLQGTEIMLRKKRADIFRRYGSAAIAGITAGICIAIILAILFR